MLKMYNNGSFLYFHTCQGVEIMTTVTVTDPTVPLITGDPLRRLDELRAL